MTEKLKQYKNLILLVLAVVFMIILIAADPLGFCAKRAHERAAIRNEMAIEKAEAERQIAIIKAQTDAELERIGQGLETDMSEPEGDTTGADVLSESEHADGDDAQKAENE